MKPMRLHHVGIIMPSMEKAEAFMDQFRLETDYMEYVEAYHAHCLLQNTEKMNLRWNLFFRQKVY